jgi:hypothetical protein
VTWLLTLTFCSLSRQPEAPIQSAVYEGDEGERIEAMFAEHRQLTSDQMEKSVLFSLLFAVTQYQALIIVTFLTFLSFRLSPIVAMLWWLFYRTVRPLCLGS